MSRSLMFCAPFLVATAFASEPAPMAEKAVASAAAASEASAKTKTDEGAKSLSGMSILGNQEAPKSLVIVPWKSSRLGDEVGMSRSLEDSRRPVDKDVFMRELNYYEIRTGSR